MSETQSTAGTPSRSSSARVALAWLVVILPAAWGVYETGVKSMALFGRTAAPTTAPTANR